jgi:tetratricopeptide (TPR) repeat protein
VPGWLNNPVSEGLLKGAFSLFKGLGAVGGVIGMFASSGGGTAIGGNTRPAKGDGKPDLFGRMLNWMQEKIEDLERKRDSELKRLTDMFEKNVDEFLQYAIQLSSPYLNRGSASPSAHLKRNPLQFNPGRLGGGQAVDGWNLDNYYDDLQSKYVKAAHQAIANNDYKKAAYVYAHLLGDYLLAANTLKQGKHYREAAALYKDHLGSPDQAAICYEDGGLYMEAIELYLETNQHERAGDLYMQLDQKERAFTCYENCVDKAAVNKDYLEQSRIINEKIGDRPRAKNVLLEGWQDVKQPEACLTKYFDLLADDNKDQLHEEVKSFYAKGELENRKLSFLNVIEDVNKKYSSAVLESTCRNIAYEVVSEQVSTGDRASLHRLRNFIPNDQLLAPDCYRFIHTSKEAPKEEPPINNIKLMKEVVWKKVLVLQDQLLAWGVKSSGALIMARTDWEGYVEHFSWFVNLEPYHSFITLADQPNTNHIILYTRGIQYGDKPLPKNKYFRDELRVYQPPFLYPNAVGIGLYNGEIITLQRVGGEVLLNSYLLTGELKTSGRCTFKDPHFQIPPTNVNELIRCHDYYYLACDNMVLRISESGIIDVLFYSQGLIQKLVVRYIQYGLVLIGFYSGDRAFFMNSADDYKADPFEVGENDVLIKDIAILTGNRYVVANEKKVQMYYDVEGNKSPELDWEHRVENKVAAVFQGPERHQLGILEENGQITFHVIN